METELLIRHWIIWRIKVPNSRQLGRNVYKEKLKLHSFHCDLLWQQEESWPSLCTGRKESWHILTCVQAGVLPFHDPSPTSSSKTHSRKCHQDKNAGKDFLEWGGGGRKKVISCLLLSDLGLLPCLGLPKLAQHILGHFSCKWLRRKTERSEEPLQPQAEHCWGAQWGCDAPPAEECSCLRNTIHGKCQGEQAPGKSNSSCSFLEKKPFWCLEF